MTKGKKLLLKKLKEHKKKEDKSVPIDFVCKGYNLALKHAIKLVRVLID